MKRTVLGAVAAAIAYACMFPVQTAGQSQAAAARTYAAKTPWGHPDLQGVWTTWDETPLQVPNPGEGNQDDSREVFVYQGREYKYAGLGSGMGREHTSPVSARRRALVTSPENGKIPIIPSTVVHTTERDLFDSYVNHGAWTRCISMGVPGRQLEWSGRGYNKAYEIFQTPYAVAIYHEMLHEVRVVPLDGRPHIGPNVKMWMGDSRGRWEGSTLVVETINFNGKGDSLNGVPQTQALRVEERFTRVDEQTLQYEVTVNDPNVYSQPWSATQVHKNDPEYVIYEYACHEGNARYMETTLGRGRLLDAEEAARRKQ